MGRKHDHDLIGIGYCIILRELSSLKCNIDERCECNNKQILENLID